jgi:hypothetical protein
MTQAFNLSQFANKVNTSGQASLTTAVTGTLPVANGGTGAATLTANNVLLGNGTSALQVVAPSTNGNVLTSNGTTWTSATPATPSPPTTLYAIGTYVIGRPQNNNTGYAVDTTVAGSSLYASGSCVYRGTTNWNVAANGTTTVTLVNTGTWRCMSPATIDSQATPVATPGLWVRIS